jgi:hypothetical protein
MYTLYVFILQFEGIKYTTNQIYKLLSMSVHVPFKCMLLCECHETFSHPEKRSLNGSPQAFNKIARL